MVGAGAQILSGNEFSSGQPYVGHVTKVTHNDYQINTATQHPLLCKIDTQHFNLIKYG